MYDNGASMPDVQMLIDNNDVLLSFLVFTIRLTEAMSKDPKKLMLFFHDQIFLIILMKYTDEYRSILFISCWVIIWYNNIIYICLIYYHSRVFESSCYDFFKL